MWKWQSWQWNWWSRLFFSWRWAWLSLGLVGGLSASWAGIAWSSTTPAPVALPATTNTANSASLKNLDRENKDALKQIILMNGQLTQTCLDKDPDACLSKAVRQSPIHEQKTEVSEKDAVSISAAAPSGRESATPKLSAPASSTNQGKISEDSIRALTDACRGGIAAACKKLAQASQERAKPRTQIQLLKRACELGDALVCRDLGIRLERSGRADLASLYKARACQHGDKSSCVSKE